jgi:hypothetical protein
MIRVAGTSSLQGCAGYTLSGNYPAGEVINGNRARLDIHIVLKNWAYINGPLEGTWTSPTYSVGWGFYQAVTTTTIGQRGGYYCSYVYAGSTLKVTACTN